LRIRRRQEIGAHALAKTEGAHGAVKEAEGIGLLRRRRLAEVSGSPEEAFRIRRATPQRGVSVTGELLAITFLVGDNPRVPTRYVHTNLIAHDWKKLVAFYVRVFGCEPVEPKRDQRGEWLDEGSGVKGAHLRGQHVRLPGFDGTGPTLEIYQYDEVLQQTLPLANRAGFGHIAFSVDDVAVTLGAVVDAGGSVHGAVVTTRVEGVGELTFTYARDPEGNLIELQSWT
jgi:predicted enzyme related to lactoylglutathione lyase